MMTLDPIKAIVGLVIAALIALLVVQQLRVTGLQLQLSKAGEATAKAEAASTKALGELAAHYRSIEQAKQFAANGVAHEVVQNQVVAARDGDAADRTIAGLRSELSRLAARPVPAAPDAASAAGIAHEAAASRELFGSCAEEYRSLAGDAESVRVQVKGLQSFADRVNAAGGVDTVPAELH